MRSVKSWETNKHVAANIQRIPVLTAAPLATGGVPERAGWGAAKGSPDEPAAAGSGLVMQCSKERFQNRRALRIAECRGFFQAKTGPRRRAGIGKNGRWKAKVVLAPLPGPRATSTLEDLRLKHSRITPKRVRSRDGGCRARHPGGALPATPDGGGPRPARGRPEQAPAETG